jgi:hypothetical protein
MSENRQVPIACNLGALDAEGRARRAALAARVMSLVTAVRERADGYALRLDPTAEASRDALEWFLLEQRCCPFLRLEVVLEPDPGPLWLRLSGGPGVKEFLAQAGLAARAAASAG